MNNFNNKALEVKQILTFIEREIKSLEGAIEVNERLNTYKKKCREWKIEIKSLKYLKNSIEHLTYIEMEEDLAESN
jgi:hypothetical protein